MNQETRQSLRPYRPALAFSFSNGLTWMIVLGSPMILLGEWIHASAFTVGMAYAALYLALPLQVLGTSTLSRFGYKRQMTFCWGARGLAVVVLLGLVIAARNGPADWMCAVYIGSIWVFCLLRAAGNSAVNPWLFAFIPQDIRGRYFATDQTLSSVCGIMVLLLVSLLFAWLGSFTAFCISLCIAIAGSVSSTTSLLFWPDVPAPEHVSLRQMFRKIPALLTSPSPYRRYTLLVTFLWLMTSPINPFGAYYLKTEAGLSRSTILLYCTFQYVGTMLGALWVGRKLDRWGVKPIFAACLGAYVLLGTYWILLVAGCPCIVHFAGIAYFIFGLCNSFFYSPNLKYLPQVCPKGDQPLAIALNIAMTGMAAGLSPVIWGYFVKYADGRPGMLHGPFLVYLALLVVSQIALLTPFMKLHEIEKTHLPELPRSLVLHIRFPKYASQLMGMSAARHVNENKKNEK